MTKEKEQVAHTPGPWHAVKQFWPGQGESWVVFHDQGPAFSSRTRDHAVPFTEANAHLIAAAPAMKQALEYVLKHCGDPVMENVARAALEIAEGK